MTAVIDESAIESLISILEEEQAFLAAGRAGDAATLLDEKLAALQTVENAIRQADPSALPRHIREGIGRIQQLAAENGRFLEAIRNGLRSVISRLEGMNSSAHVGLYGRNGSKTAFTLATGGYSRRA